jgi:MarR family transcriptional regulator for hemolysin
VEQSSLLQLVNRVHRALARDGDAVLRPLGLRYAQIPVFAYLLRRPGATQKALAEATGIEQPSMAQLLPRMDRDGLVRHSPNPQDARSRTVSLTNPRDPRLQHGNERLADLERQALTGLAPAEIELLRSLLTRVQENLDHVASTRER